jgi:hypothetical protein
MLRSARPIILDIIEDRHERKSIIITSQLPVANWYDAIGDFFLPGFGEKGSV